MDVCLIEGLMEVVVPAVREYVNGALAKATGPLLTRIAELEARDPIKGQAGKSVTLDDVRPLILEEVAKIPPAEPGKSVTVDDVRPVLAEMVAALPKPEDGKSVTVDDVRPLIVEEVAKIPPAKDGKDIDPVLVESAIKAEVTKQVEGALRALDCEMLSQSHSLLDDLTRRFIAAAS